jgi:hypothetical protein
MYTEYTLEVYDELWDYMDSHAILIEAENNTELDSLDAIRKEIEKRKKNWEELVIQEWGVSITATEFGFGDLNLREHLGFWDAQAIVFTDFRAQLAMPAMYRELVGEEKMQELFEKIRGKLEKQEKIAMLGRFPLSFVVRIPTYQWEFPFSNYLALLRYGDKELEPTFLYQRESKIYYDHKVQYDESYKEKKEFTELGLGFTDSIATFLYFDFLIEDKNFDPQGKVELWLLTERGEEGVFTVDLSKMR